MQERTKPRKLESDLDDKSSTQWLPKLRYQNYWNETPPNNYKKSWTRSIRKISWRDLLFDKLSQFNKEPKSISFAHTHKYYFETKVMQTSWSRGHATHNQD